MLTSPRLNRLNKKETLFALAAIAMLAVVAYLPALAQPFIEDDYPNLRLALEYGPVSGWQAMAADSVQRVRATSFLFMYGVYGLFGLAPVAFYAANILLHILNCWLLFAAGRWPVLGYRLSFWAAAFFAVYEGHQEAVMWFSACNELLLFLFGFLSFLCWLRFLEGSAKRELWLGLSIVSFGLALLSKESAIIFVPLFALPFFFSTKTRRSAHYLIVFALLGGVVALSIFLTRSHSFRFQDRSFVLNAPFWLTWIKSYSAMLWFWGLSALLALLAWRERKPVLWLSLAWMGLGFIPYMFVDYMHRIPSRQTYLASAGLAWLLGAAIVKMQASFNASRAWLAPAILAILLIHNVGYLWTKKREQFRLRAQPTEEFLAFARKTSGPIYVKCFPLHPMYAESIMELMLQRSKSELLWNEEETQMQPPPETFCFNKN